MMMKAISIIAFVGGCCQLALVAQGIERGTLAIAGLCFFVAAIAVEVERIRRFAISESAYRQAFEVMQKRDDPSHPHPEPPAKQ